MPMPASRALRRWLHLLLLALLAVGVVVQPVMAAACRIADVAAAAAHDDGAGADDADGGAASLFSGDDCCSSGSCVDCCLHAVAHPAAPVAIATVAFPPVRPAFLAHAPPPRAYPVDIRPPIAG